jgi:trehalose/maltose transport system permease protein
MFTTPISYWPHHPTLEFYREVFSDRLFMRSMLNSTIVAGSVTIISLLIGAFASFALGRFTFKGRTPVMYIILAMTMFPQIAILGSLFQMVRNFGLYDRLPALIITYLTFTLPFTVWVLTNFFRAMPAELEEAALVDGATPFRTFWEILLPLAMPGLVTTGLLAFIQAWNEFLFALTFTLQRARTVQPALASFSGNTQYDLPWGNIMAASVLVTIPLVVLVLIFQRKILGGLTAGAVKG